MNNKILLFLLVLSSVLSGCASTFTTMDKRPDGTYLMLVASQQDLMTATSDAIINEFPSDHVNELKAPKVGYKWTHWFQMNPGTFEITFKKVTGQMQRKGRIAGWSMSINQVATGIDYDNDMGKLVSAVQQSLLRSEHVRVIRATNVRLATKADLAAAKPVAVKQESGTGFFVSTDGFLVTNNHVIEGANRIEVHASNGNIYRAKVVSRDPTNDVALLKVEAWTRPLRIEPTSTVRLGEQVFTLGYPLPDLEGTQVKATFGRINALSGINDDIRYFQMDVPIQPGNSGGPLIDNDGAVIGITSATVNQRVVVARAGTVAQNVNYAIKSEYFLTLLKYANVHLAQGRPEHAAIDNPSQFEPSVVQIVASQQVSP